jgi:soluble lytic murein transglycosylase-like protein
MTNILKLLALGLCTATCAHAQQANADTAAKAQYASFTGKTEAGYITKEANVVFPALLAGNEAEMMEYVENFSKKRRDYLIRTFNRSKRFFPKAANILKKYHIPHELKVLLALESGFNGNAVSGAGAVGYWQIMDETARQYGLRIVEQPTKEEKALAAKVKLTPDSLAKIKRIQAKDERRNFNRSTHAAAKYLRDRCRNLDNNWLLIVASYNCGVGNVWEAIAKSGKANPSFWDIKAYLPAETRNYVLNFITLNVIFSNYEKFAAGKLTFKPVQVKVDGFEKNVADALAAPASLK